MSGNFVQISRKVLKDEIIMTDGDYFAVYMFLMLNVTHTEQPKKFKGEWITLKPGQGIFGREDIAKKLKIHESKIQRILTKFKNEQLIEQQTSNQNRLVTMLFWDSKGDSEQLNEQRMNNECTTDEQRMNTNNKENKENKEKKEDNKELTVVADAKPKRISKPKNFDLSNFDYDKYNLYESEVDVLKQFIVFRSEVKKKPLTENALNLIIKQIFKVMNDRSEFIPIIEQSIRSDWQDVFELKDNKTKGKNSQSKIEMANAGRTHNMQNTLFLDGGL